MPSPVAELARATEMPRADERGLASVELVASAGPLADRLLRLLSREGYRVRLTPVGYRADSSTEGGAGPEGVTERRGSDELVASSLAESVAALRPDLVVLDAALTDPSALELCRALRLIWNGPLLLVSPLPPGVDSVAGFEAGADDHLVQPERDRELLARVRTLLRRRSRPTPALNDEVLTVGDVTLDPERHQVWVAGQEVILSRKEFALLELLMANPGRVLVRSRLMAEVWGSHLDPSHKTLEVHIGRLRSKIEDDPARPARILTVRGIGYRYRSP